MKRIFTWIVMGCLALGTARADSSPLYQNFGTISNPSPIDAANVENYGTIFALGTLPFDTQNTTNYLNASDSLLIGYPGISLQYVPTTGFANTPAYSITNLGNMLTDTRLILTATNISSPGVLSTRRAGLLQINGSNVDLSLGALRAGDTTDTTVLNPDEGFPIFLSTLSYNGLNDVIEYYWGAGTANVNLSTLSFDLLSGFSPTHTVTLGPGVTGAGALSGQTRSGNSVFVPGYSFFLWTNFVFTGNNAQQQQVHGVVQMVFVQTNLLDNPVVHVFVGTPFNTISNVNNRGVSDVVVSFETSDMDPTTGQPFSRFITLRDVTALDQNAPAISQNLQHIGNFRPFDFQLFRDDTLPFGFEGFETQPTNYDPNYVFTFQSNNSGGYNATTVSHDWNSMQFAVNPYDTTGAGFGILNTNKLVDPTNSPGRIEINADQLNLQFASMRADNYISINANNVSDMTGLTLNSPNINFNLLSSTGSVYVPNIFPTTVSRMNGIISVWSGSWTVNQNYTNNHPVWTNELGFFVTAGTIDYIYQVTMIDAELTTNMPVSVQNFTVNNQDVTIDASMNITKNFLINGTSLTVPPTGTFSLGGNVLDFTAANAPNLYNLTNQGTIIIPSLGNFGYDRALPYSNIVNEGVFEANSLNFASHFYLNTNFLLTSAGALNVRADTNRFAFGFVSVGGDINLSGNDFVATNTTISTAGRMTLNFTNRLTDLNVTNTWTAQNGFSLLKAPVKGDLLSTMLISQGKTNLNTSHTWSAQNRGDTASGFANNAAVGRLVLDGAPGSRFIFSGQGTPGVTNAIYVDYLEFRDSATNSTGTANTNALFVQPNLIIYFGDANVPQDKLTNAYGGRIVWASPSSVQGPMMTFALSSTLTTNISSRAARALLPGNLDYDGDGIPNSDDPDPLIGFKVDSINVVNVPPLTTIISWYALPNVNYLVEYRTDIASNNWTLLQTVSTPTPGEVTATDPVPSTGQRYYRVRYVRPTQ